MMNKTLSPREIGEIFEEYAAEFYRKKGYAILFHSFVYGKYEIDLIVKKKDTVVFVEVKARNAKNNADPLDRIDYRKMRNINRCAEGFKKHLKQKHIDPDALLYRYDSIGFLYDDDFQILRIEREKDFYRPRNI